MAVMAVSAFAETISAPSPLDTARALMGQGKYAEAIIILREADLSQSSPSQTLRMLGDCCKAQKNWEQAIEYFGKALPGSQDQATEKDIRVQMMDCNLAAGNTGSAFAALDELAADYPNEAPRFHYVIGRRYQWNHEYGKAAKELSEATKLPPTDPDAKDAAKRYICCCLSAMDFDGALAYLPTFVSNHPDSIPEVVSKELYRWKFKIPQVIEIVDKAIATTGRDTTEMRIGLADCYLATNNWDKGLSTLKAIPENKRSANWHVAMAKCYWGQERKTEAAEELKQAISMGSGVDSKELLMEYYRDMDEQGHMLAQAQLLEKEWPERTGEWLMNQGWACLNMERYEKAIPLFREAVSRYPDDRWVVRGSLVSLGECLYRLGKGQEALSSLDDYYERRPELKQEHLLIHAKVMWHGAVDSHATTIELKKLIADYPGHSIANEARQFLTKVLLTTGNWDEAVQWLEDQASGIPEWREWDKVAMNRRIAYACFMGKQYAKAANIYKRLMKTENSNEEDRADAMCHLGMCEYKMGHRQSGMVYLSHLIERYPNTPAAKDATGMLRIWAAGDIWADEMASK